ncbi:MAG: hypothetical protein KKE57_03115, partial [Proteobacteria bacterium]|nr:hypothetical protein [Pseudomonadota bacterium]
MAPHQVRDKLQPESSVLKQFWTPGPVPDPDPGFAGETVFGNMDEFCNYALGLRTPCTSRLTSAF